MKNKYLKCYNFKLKITGEAIGYVYATNEEEAKEFIMNKAHEECNLINYFIEEIENIEED